ncbi:MAG TPA: FkbM family methyltransferase [Pyrinomonadaceae bacterium]
MSLKSSLKRLRSSQPFNRATTSSLKLLFDVTKWQPESVFKHLPRVGKTKITLPDGNSFLIDSSGEDWIPTQLFWRGWLGYEPEVTPVFYQLAGKAHVVIDIGAHVGFFSVLAARANSQSQVVAFEPLQRVYDRLERNVALNKLKNVRCVKAAVGQEEGEQQFYFPDVEAPVSSSLRSDMLLSTLGEGVVRQVTVSVVTLDSFVQKENLGSVDLIKMDTERTEHEVLNGAKTILTKDRPDIICEVWPDADNIQQLEALLRPHGYRFYQLLPDGPKLRERIEPAADALNYLFTCSSL